MESIHSIPAVRSSYKLLKLVYGIVPIVAGLDKFTNFHTDWEQYLNPTLAGVLPISASAFMMIVGVIEIIAGLIVLRKPFLGGMIVSAWLTLIALTLIVSGRFLDVAVRDLVMAIGAFCMARMAAENELNS